MGDVVVHYIYMYHFIYLWGIIWAMSLFIIFTCITLYTFGELYGWCCCSLYLHVSLYIPLGNYMGGVVAPHIYICHCIPLGN